MIFGGKSLEGAQVEEGERGSWRGEEQKGVAVGFGVEGWGRVGEEHLRTVDDVALLCADLLRRDFSGSETCCAI